ncbi:FtsX-like permease family protein [Fredinandcohnia sp. QZ13]|uniref:ABC transporter permease n=1 Tax=Fredinandcohnia sp. QZ13 TaxID=3073144 RepID=UPI002853159B|nr:FtsX-like permease family protein [Fredinandcohnia sp. QZ13]MDR4886303.1 FtsX-like permease family protein [Fredinandcohnia sp. QZ13]
MIKIINYLKSSFKQRWLLYIIILIILNSVGLGYIVAQSVSDRIVIEAKNDLDKYWRYQYDIHVIPEEVIDTRNLEGGWVPPQSSLTSYGGISMKDLELIRNLPGVKVAAPLSMIGFYEGESIGATYSKAKPGEFYEVVTESNLFDGLKEYRFSWNNFITNYYSSELEDSLLYHQYNKEKNIPEGFRIQVPPGTHFRYPNQLMIVAIDPKAEAALYSFTESNVDVFQQLESPITTISNIPEVPLLALTDQNYDVTETLIINKIDVPSTVSEQELSNGAEKYIRSLQKNEVVNFSLPSYSPEWKHKKVELFLENQSYKEKSYKAQAIQELFKYGPISYEIVSNKENTIPQFMAKEQPPPELAWPIDFPSYRNQYDIQNVSIWPKVVGNYNAENIIPKLSKSWKQGDPIDIYTAQHSLIIEDGAGNPVDPRPLIPMPLKYAYYPGAPDLLAPIEAAKIFYGDEPPISSIRIVVDDVSERSSESQRKIEQVAKNIMDKTGHHVEIMLGSAAGKVHVQLEGTGEGEVGVVEEGWQQQGVSWSIEKQIEETNKWLFIYLLITSFIFCYTVTTHSLLKRSTEFATLRAIGWSRNKIIGGLIIEITCISTLSLLSMIIANSFINLLNWHHFLIVWLLFMIITGIGYVSGSRRALWLSPRAGLAGDSNQWSSKRLFVIRGLGTYVIHQLMRRPLRFSLLVGTLALTIFMAILFVATQQSLSDFLFLSLLGETIDLNLKSYQRIFLIGGLILTVSIVFFLLFLNIIERKNEFLIMRSIGWSMKRIQVFLSFEVILIAVIGSLIGSISAYLIVWLFSAISLPIWTIIVSFFTPVCLLLVFTVMISRLISLESTVKDQHSA